MQIRVQNKGKRAWKSRYVGDVSHTDVCGPMSVEAHGGYCYFLTFINDLSRYGYIYLMKHKSEIFEKFMEF
jgi:hypothetical protein